MRAVLSPEPLTKRRPSGSSAREVTSACVVREGAHDGAVVDVEELDGLVVRAGERVLVVGQRHEGTHPAAGVQLEGVLEGAVEEPHADGVVAWRPPLRMRWPSGIAATASDVVGVPGAGAHEALGGDAPHLDVLSNEPLMMCWPSGVTATACTVDAGVLDEGVDERPVDVVQPDVLLIGARQGRPQSARRRAAPRRTAPRLPTSKVRSRAPSSVHSFAVPSSEPLTKRAPPGSTATA